MLPLEGFWADVGQPKDFLIGTGLYLGYLAKKEPEKLTKTIEGSQVVGSILVDPSAKIGKNCKIGPNVVIGPKCVVGDGVRLNNAVIMTSGAVKDVRFVSCCLYASKLLVCSCQRLYCRMVLFCWPLGTLFLSFYSD